jgi:hypothetical protein
LVEKIVAETNAYAVRCIQVRPDKVWVPTTFPEMMAFYESMSTSEILISLPMLLVSASSISDRLKPSNSLSPSSELKKDFQRPMHMQ